MIIDNGNPFGGKDAAMLTRKDFVAQRCRFWYDRLFGRALAAIRWNGLPDTVNAAYLTSTLFIRGFVTWTKDHDGNLRALDLAAFGFDPYRMPTQFEGANPVLGQLSGVYGVNGVFGRCNALAEPLAPVIEEYAGDLAQLDVDIRVNLDNYKLATIFRAGTPQQAQKWRNIYADIIAGKPAVIEDKGLMDDPSDVRLFTTAAEYGVTNMLKDRQTVINAFLTQIGVNNVNVEKAERLITAEADANNEEIVLNRRWMLDYLEEQAAAVNEMFGTNITVVMTVEKEVTTDEMREKDALEDNRIEQRADSDE